MFLFVIVLIILSLPNLEGYGRLLHNNKLFSIRTQSISGPLLETDYLGTLNFCLRSTDTELSGPSRSKVLNAITNNVFKAIMIGNSQIIDSLVKNMENYREQVTNANCVLGMEDGSPAKREDVEVACTQDLLLALIYLDSLEKLLVKGTINDAVIGGLYDRGYKLLLTSLRNGGCIFSTTGDKRPVPIDNNICLSILDASLPESERTITKELNMIANWVPRAMLYGAQKDRNKLAGLIDAMIPSIAKEWLNGDLKSQEICFLNALIVLLREGVEAAERAINYVESSSSNLGVSNITGLLTDVLVIQEPPLRLYDTYNIAFQRVVNVCLKEMGARLSSVPVDEAVLQTLSKWEQSIRTNLTEQIWNTNPAELVGKWELINGVERPESSGGTGTGAVSINSDSLLMKNEKVRNVTDIVLASLPLDTSILFLPRSPPYQIIIELRKDGTMELLPPRGSAYNWKFLPGPAHLDTCEFTVRSADDSDLVLQYTGYIDRGQRVESRCVSVQRPKCMV